MQRAAAKSEDSYKPGSSSIVPGYKPQQYQYRLNLNENDDVHKILATNQEDFQNILTGSRDNEALVSKLHERKLLSNLELEQLIPIIHADNSPIENQNQGHEPFKRFYTVTRPLVTSIEDSQDKKTIKQSTCLKSWYLFVIAFFLIFGCLIGMNIQNLFCSLSENQTKEFETDNSSCFPSRQTAKSLNEFLRITNATHVGPMKSVTIEISRSIDWPIGLPIGNLTPVCDITLSGKMHVTKIIDILAHCPVHGVLHIANKDNLICSEAFDDQYGLKGLAVNVTNQELVLEGFNAQCSRFLRILETRVEMKQVKEFKFIRGSVDAYSMLMIEKILSKSRMTLQKVEVLESTNSVELFNSQKLLTFPEVKTIIYDVTTNAVSATYSKLCVKFPSLDYFLAGDDMQHPNDDMQNLLGCSNMKTMKTTIHVNGSSISFGFLGVQFPNLCNAEIYIKFINCKPGLIIRDTRKLRENLVANLKTSTNCKENITVI